MRRTTTMYVMRRADEADAPTLARLVRVRAQWMSWRGLPDGYDLEKPARAEAIARQATDGRTPVWLLADENNGRVLGFTSLYPETPLWGWTEAEQDEPALFMATTFTDPDRSSERPGALMAWWALGYAARTGRVWVRRGCTHETLMRYYRDVQGFDVIHSVYLRGALTYLMARKAEELPRLPVRTAARSATVARNRYRWPLNPAVPITYST
ncbi:GNAT family N-acetyltransferase [Streptomyces sp. AV19]|uniref:GNAT family N-acetyltransferase n=1 Tax=Streptomyces sp. AV19 TaxID=2793068 RepID=UPI0018FE2683|nr:GNAT family N-acetyltransferase [Streptomyces sp. AV19]MBH1936590.1 GNAT family N-acetyltransferase [Streptomyces sp. AV19]MDG4532650.1 GNAT family N-acetyltransferase [Streptomyces sp. AV19]